MTNSNTNSRSRGSKVPLRELVREGAAVDGAPPHGQRQHPVEAEPELGRGEPKPRPPPGAVAPGRHVRGSVQPYQKNPREDRAREQPVRVRRHLRRFLRHEQRWAVAPAADAAPGHPFLCEWKRRITGEESGGLWPCG